MTRISLAIRAGLLATVLLGAIPPGSAQSTRPRIGDLRILLETTAGDVVLGLYPDVAPQHVRQLLRLVEMGVYDSAWFHRVDPNFVIQLTDAQNRSSPLSSEQRDAIVKLPLERAPIVHHRGVLSMARQDADENSAETSFSILLVDAPHLDGKYTVFGEVEHGWPVVEAIRAVATDAQHQPLERVSIQRARVLNGARLQRMIRDDLLRGPIQQGVRADAGPGWVTSVAIGFMMLCGLLVHFGSGRYSAKLMSALGLLCILMGAFWSFVTFTPLVRTHSHGGLLLFFGLVALFRLMNRFESGASAPKQ